MASEPLFAYLLLVGLAALATFLLSRLITNAAGIVLASAGLASVAFQVINWLTLGYLDKFWIIAFLIQFAASAVVSSLCLIPILLRRRARKSETGR